MIKHPQTILIQAPTGEIAQQKKEYLEKLSQLDPSVLKILADKSSKNGISQKLIKFQHLI